MRILHLCLSSFYIDGYSYQENELVAQNVADGHDVTVVASTESFGEDRCPIYLPPGTYMGGDGARVVRLPYRKILPHAAMRKIRMHPGLYDLLETLAPDVMLFHGMAGWELLTVARYKRKHTTAKLYVDSHTDANNSARSYFSMTFLHRLVYKPIIARTMDCVEKILCVNVDAMTFAREVYGVPNEKLEFYPLGGKIYTDTEYELRRRNIRKDNDIDEEVVLFVQSGKMDRRKKVVESVRAFTATANPRFRFFLIGHLHDDVAEDVQTLVAKDARIKFIGWKTQEELRDLLCAADVYVQPGTQSATMQMSLCCRCAVVLDDVSSHHPYINGNGWLVGRRLSLKDVFCTIGRNSAIELIHMEQRSGELASRFLDYKKLAARLYS